MVVGLVLSALSLLCLDVFVGLRLPELLATACAGASAVTGGACTEEPNLVLALAALGLANVLLLGLWLLPAHVRVRTRHGALLAALVAAFLAGAKQRLDVEYTDPALGYMPPPLLPAEGWDGGPPVAVVTGANAGIGLEISKMLAGQYGMHVVMGCRNVEKCEYAAEQVRREAAVRSKGKESKEQLEARVEPMELDLSRLESVYFFAKNVQKKHSRVHVLVNNAGLIPERGAVTKQGVEMGLGVMHLGHHALTMELWKALRDGSRVVTVTGSVYWFGRFDKSLFRDDDGEGDLRCEKTNSNGLFGSYARAKLANLLFNHQLDYVASHMDDVNITAVAVHPGEVQTNLAGVVAKAMHMDSVAKRVEEFVLRTPRQAASVVVYAALAPDIPSASFLPGVPHPMQPSRLGDERLPRRLWQVTTKILVDWRKGRPNPPPRRAEPEQDEL